ncbi:MAG: S8 family peptidase, partial [Chloroflexia bacterium]
MLKVKKFGSRRSMAGLALALTLSLFSPASGWAAQPQTVSALGRPLSVSPSQSLPLQDPSAYEPGELLVKVATGDAIRSHGDALFSASPALTQLMSCFDLRSAMDVLPGVYKLQVASDSGLDVEAAAQALVASGTVAYAEPNYHVYATLAPNDEQYVAGQQWGITQIKAEQAWDVTTGATNIVIAVLDTGTATDHPDLADKIVPGYDFINNDNNPYDDVFHGTQTAGVAAASSNNGEGVAGVSWGARIMPVKVLGPRGGSDDAVARGIRWAVDNGAKIINASLGSPSNARVLREAVEYAHARGVLFVAAAGNTPDGKSHYPAAYESVLSVGATGRSDTVTGFSSWGPFVDVSAPGVGILSTSWNDGQLNYEYNNGTSYSAPFVAGLAALVWSVNPSFTADQVKQIVEDSSDDLGTPGFDEYYGRGRVNALRAVQMAQQGPPVPRPPTPVGQATLTPVPVATQPGNTGGPSLQLDAKEVGPGGLMALTGAGFGVNELVELSLVTSNNNTRGIGSAQSGAQGAFRAEVALPSDTPLGNATIMATGIASGLRASVGFTVSATGGL